MGRARGRATDHPHRGVKRRTAAAVLTVALLITACGSETNTALGVVTAFEGDLLTVTSFSVRTVDGRDLTFIPELQTEALDFPLPHLQEHLATGEQIQVRWKERSDGTLVAVAITDG